jgi:hypothetical protein
MRCSCSGLNIDRCDPDGSACSLVEYCANGDGCVDTGYGAICMELRDYNNDAGFEYVIALEYQHRT